MCDMKANIDWSDKIVSNYLENNKNFGYMYHRMKVFVELHLPVPPEMSVLTAEKLRYMQQCLREIIVAQEMHNRKQQKTVKDQEIATDVIPNEILGLLTQAKKKKYRLRGRSSETAKAHRG
eukprot:TRINITY_DN3154_c0_g2_i1.p1 TRINITY_DN3154_c0_g2~~TRINITY_DN3154_c0_g2_i1.p1  ORF type:complete len:121 (-),score=47.73 TRINITY_DN3154_c0_g2_i1:2-364(-)